MVRFYPLMWSAFGVAAASGVALLIADATTKLAQPVFWVKMLFIALAVVNLQMIRTRVFGDPLLDQRPLSSRARTLAISSLVLWIAATIAGRLIAYIN
ncbi:hypothetical protein D3C83_62190 [compost metagenome]